MDEITRVRALCCYCGNLRTISANYHYRLDENRSNDAGPDRERHGWRMTGTLKCSVCKRPARHAVLRDEDGPHMRDNAEREFMTTEV
jgi:hypothetical protein